MYSIVKGADSPIKFQLKTAETGLAFDLTTLAGFIIVLYYAADGKVIEKFSQNALAGYESIIPTDLSGGIFGCNLQSATTASLECGDIHAEIKTQSSDAAFDDSNFHSIIHGIEIGTVVDSLTKSTMVP